MLIHTFKKKNIEKNKKKKHLNIIISEIGKIVTEIKLKIGNRKCKEFGLKMKIKKQL